MESFPPEVIELLKEDLERRTGKKIRTLLAERNGLKMLDDLSNRIETILLEAGQALQIFKDDGLNKEPAIVERFLKIRNLVKGSDIAQYKLPEGF